MTANEGARRDRYKREPTDLTREWEHASEKAADDAAARAARLRALLAAHPGRDTAPDSEGQADEREARMAALSDEAIRVAEDVWTEDEPTLAEYELTERILATARTDALAEVERRITEAFPLNGELRHDGTADPTASAYVEGLHDAWRIVREVRAAADAPATEGGAQ